jgi:translocation and assembly module TamB
MRARALLIAAALALTPTLAPVSALAQDDDGPGFLTRLLQDNLSGAGRTVTIRGFEGALSSQARMAELTIADADGVWLTLRDATLDWSRAALFSGRVEVQSLTARELIIDRIPPSEPAAPSPEAQGFALPDLPVSVEIGQLAVDRAALGAPVLGQPVEVRLGGTLTLAGGAGAADIALDRIDGQTGRIALVADYANATRELALDLSVTEGPGGLAATALGLPGSPSVDLSVQGAGPLDAFDARLRLATAGADRLTGQLRLSGAGDGGTAFDGTLQGDVAPLFLPDYAAFFGPDVRLTVRGTRAGDGALALSAVNLRAAALSLQGAARIAPGGLPESFAVAGRIAADDGNPVLLPVAGDAITVSRADLTAEFDAARGDGWRTRFDIAGLTRGDVSIATLALGIDGTITGGATPAVAADITFAADGLGHADPALAGALGTGLAGGARIDWQAGQPVALTGLSVTGAGLALTGRATLDTAQGIAIAGAADLSADDLSRFAGLVGRPVAGGITGNIDGEGDALAGTFDIALTVSGQDLTLGLPEADPYLRGATEIQVFARRDAGGTFIDQMMVTGDGVTLDGTLSLTTPEGATSPQAAGTATFRLNDIAPLSARAGRPLTGGIAGQLDLTATLDGQTAHIDADLTGNTLSLGIPEADAYLGGATRLTLSVSRDGTTGRIDRLALDTRDGPRTVEFDASGDLSFPDSAAPGFDGTATARVSDLSPLSSVAGRALAGGAQATIIGRLTSDLRNADIAVDSTATALSVGGTALGDITATLQATRDGTAARIASLSLTGAGVSATGSGDLTLPDDGTAPAFDGTLDVDVADLSRLSGLTGTRLSGAITARASGQIITDLSAFDTMLTAAASGLSTGQPEADRILGGRADLSLSASRAGDAIAIRTARLTTARGATEATGALNGRDGELRLTSTLDDLGLLVPGITGPVRLTGTVAEAPGALTVALDATGPAGVTGQARGTVARTGATADLSLTGTAPLALANPFIAPRNLAGTARYDLRLNGAPSLGALSGTVTLDGGRIVDPGLALVIQDLGGTATLSGGRATLNLAARSQAGGGLTLSGPVTLSAPFAADLRAGLTGLRLTDPALFDTSLSGSVTVAGPLTGGARIGGLIDVGRTEVRIPSSGYGVSGELLELVHLDEPADVRQTRARAGLLAAGEARATGTGPAFPLDLTIRAPDQVFVRGRGLDAELGGTLRLAGSTAALAPEGGFRLIRGRLDLLGKRLDLTSGLVRLEGGAGPWLELTAEGASADTRVFVDVTGPAAQPEFTFRSEPDLPQDEVLAVFLFGRDVTQLSALQALQLAGAVAELAGRGGAGIVSRLRGGLGLDDLDVSTAEDGTTAVRGGRYLSENVYTDVTVQGGETVINLNLDVIDNVTIKGSVSSDGGTGLGVFYERDF